MYQVSFDKPIHVHFIGIGGISMSALAHILLNRGFTISGSDSHESPITDELEAAGMKISYPQSADNITDDIDLVVYTAAISEDNPELIAARESRAALLTRAELLGEIMDNYSRSIAVAGTHGKTTTTSMVSHILMSAEADPTVTVGGILHSIGGNYRIGASDVFLAEACEYTNSFHNFRPYYSLILNVEADHLDFFKDIDDIRRSFNIFAKQTHPEGALIVSSDIPALEDVTRGVESRVVTCGLDEGADYYASDVSAGNAACYTFTACSKDGELGRVTLNVPGIHNVKNSLCAIALADLMGIPFDVVAAGLNSFKGTDRRFELKGTKNGFTIIDDYAHHPTEIKATLAAAANYPHEKLYVAFQPHTYTRTQALLPEFGEALSAADCVILADIYAAREQNTIGITSEAVKDEVAKHGTEAYYFTSFEEIEKFILKNLSKNDLLITMGAGNIVDVGEDLLRM